MDTATNDLEKSVSRMVGHTDACWDVLNENFPCICGSVLTVMQAFDKYLEHYKAQSTTLQPFEIANYKRLLHLEAKGKQSE